MSRFVYLKPSLAAVLMFVGAKMLIVDIVKIPPTASLAVVCGILGIGVAASVWRARSHRATNADRPVVERP